MNARNARPLRQRLALACSELAVVALFALPSAAWAQAEPEEASAEQSDVAETPSGPPATEDGEGTIVVTGSRLVTGFQSPNPT